MGKLHEAPCCGARANESSSGFRKNFYTYVCDNSNCNKYVSCEICNPSRRCSQCNGLKNGSNGQVS
jgi:hypothetical protein